ncbi:sensor histidine kinase [Desulforhopalus singaporensis]|uniref:histidine kinase n=1 Tax=Desulforhopalus singaporensis TaxID=91360 RepID=A0A1H0KK59_9BACT|nr:HAMP domain-containing sensor histidine kinase [Desulforhopalus singaporensis]SDO56329.1 Signal transduction histidine kinase [Desulforhopalus singaporensis]
MCYPPVISTVVEQYVGMVMEGLRKKLVLVCGLAAISLVIQLVAYIYQSNEFQDDFKNLQNIHNFMENVLDLRRYEKNFVYRIDRADLEEMLVYIDKIESGLESVRKSPVVMKYEDDINQFQKDLAEYRQYTLIAQNGQEADLRAMRECGHKLLLFSQKVLDQNQIYISAGLHKIMIVPATVMFLFSGGLIVALMFLTIATIKQIKFVTSTTRRIAQGDFRPVSPSETGYHTYPMIIKAFNRMIKELDYRHEQIVQSRKLAAVGILASGIAHEVNNPLNNISLTAEALIEERGQMDPADEEEMLLDILSEVTRASKVVNNLLDFSRSHGKMVFEPVDVIQMLKTTLKLIRNQIMLARVTLKTDFPQGECWINGDLDSLKQIFINLCLNAIQAMPDGGLLSLSIVFHHENMVTILVKDTGYGMSPEVIEKIFVPFYTTKSTGQGTGLGLSVVYGIIKKHNGFIEVNSNVDNGTVFAVSFPFLREPEPDNEKDVENGAS